MSILETGIQIPLFNPDNFAKANLVKELMMSKVANFKGTGDVVYTQCDDDAGAFTLDKDNTNNVPAPAVKGSDIALNLAGSVDDTITVTNVHIHVDWNQSTLYDEDHAQNNQYDSTYNYSLKWSIPSYAPSGAYHVVLKGTGASSSGPGSVLCINADFTLWAIWGDLNDTKLDHSLDRMQKLSGDLSQT